MKKLYTIFVLVVLVGLGLYLAGRQPDAPGTSSPLAAEYRNDAYGVSFSYPEGYVLQEGEHGSAHRAHYAVTLIREEDSAPRENSEGPTAISVDIYQNNLDQQQLVSWLKGTNDSNFKLSDGTYASTTVDGVEAVQYRWSGLYEGETTAFRHNGNIIAVSVTYITPQDANIATYRDVLRSFTLLDPQKLDEADAIQFVQGMFPGLDAYPSDNLPPKRIATTSDPRGWYIGFLTLGSGRPGILIATCYFVSHSKEVTKTGDFSAGAGAGPEALDLETCTVK